MNKCDMVDDAELLDLVEEHKLQFNPLIILHIKCIITVYSQNFTIIYTEDLILCKIFLETKHLPRFSVKLCY